MSTGLQTYFGIAEETTVGTYVAPTEFLPIRSSTLKRQRGVIYDDSIINGIHTRDFTQAATGSVTVAGRVSLALFRGDVLNLILEHMFGTQSGTGTTIDKYLWTPATLKGKGLSIVIGKTRTDGTINPEAFLGCKIASWSISIPSGDNIATLDLDIVGIGFDDSIAAPTITRQVPAAYNYLHSALTIGGDTPKVSSLTISGNNGLNDSQRYHGSDTIDEPLIEDDRTWMYEPTIEFEDTTYIDVEVAGITYTTLTATLTAGDDVLQFTAGGLLEEGADPDIPGKARLEAPLKYRVVTGLGVAESNGIRVNQWDAGT